MINKILTFKKIKFYDFPYQKVKKMLFQKKGYLVIPAASSLVQIKRNNKYFQALKKSTIAIFDSGYFCLCLFFLRAHLWHGEALPINMVGWPLPFSGQCVLERW